MRFNNVNTENKKIKNKILSLDKKVNIHKFKKLDIINDKNNNDELNIQ